MASDKTTLGDRIKEYENATKHKLVKRMPVMIRLDGKAFHTFCRGFDKPFDPVMSAAMKATTLYLCENVQNCVFGYTQSDEITLILVDYKGINTDAWFDNTIQKIVSVSASMATMVFNREFARLNEWYYHNTGRGAMTLEHRESFEQFYKKRKAAIEKGACFDARVFNVPQDDCVNAVLWRQNDAIRNSKQSVAQQVFSPKELHGKSCDELMAMVKEKTGLDWNDLPVWQQRGTAIVKEDGHWIVDEKMPILKDEGRDYVEHLIKI